MTKKDLKKDLNLTRFNLTQIQDWQLEEGAEVVDSLSYKAQRKYNEKENIFVYSYENKNGYTRFCIMDDIWVYMDGLTKDEVKHELEQVLYFN